MQTATGSITDSYIEITVTWDYGVNWHKEGSTWVIDSGINGTHLHGHSSESWQVKVTLTNRQTPGDLLR